MFNYFDSPDELNNLNLDLTNYYYFEKYFSDNEINKILKISEKYETVDGEVSKNIDKSYRSSNIKWIPENKETEWIYENLKVLVKKANKKMWNFDLVGFGENIQIGEYSYEDNGHYDWHLDIGEKCNFRKISVSVQLSDPQDYDGGDLQFNTNRNIRTAPKNKGDVILFPSYFLHRVTKIKRGIRRSLVIWITGKPFK